MKKQLLFLSFMSLCFLLPSHSSFAKKKRVFKKNWSFSIVNGYTFHQQKKASARDVTEWGDLEGQMHPFFSSLEISRNLGYYEIGAKIQNLGPTFISPFFKWNWRKNNSKASIVPALTLGFVPSHIMGSWLRMEVGLSLNSYVSIAPFAGVFAWYKIKDDAKYEKHNFHLNAGLRISLYR